MNKKLILNLLPALFVAFAAGCSNEAEFSVVPHYSGIVCDPATPSAGDSITLTARQDQKGYLINATTYEWTFSYRYFYDGAATKDTTVVKSEKTNYDGISSADPVMGFRIPADIAGNLTVSIRGFFSCSAQTASGALYGETVRSTQITVQ